MPRRKKEEEALLSDKDRPPRGAANARERTRMRVLSKAFGRLKLTLPWVPPDTKLSKLDTLRLATSYIAHLKRILQQSEQGEGEEQDIEDGGGGGGEWRGAEKEGGVGEDSSKRVLVTDVGMVSYNLDNKAIPCMCFLLEISSYTILVPLQKEQLQKSAQVQCLLLFFHYFAFSSNRLYFGRVGLLASPPFTAL